MSDWQGKGLPPAALERLARAEARSMSTSLLSINGQAGLHACGFETVGEVMGCLVLQIGFSGYGGCGWVYGYATPNATVLGRYASGAWGAGFGPYLDAVESGWNGAIGRMMIECESLGGDGVVDVRLSESSLGNGATEYLAMGTAVRALGNVRAKPPFSTTLGGPDVAKLLHGGYVPVEVIVALSVGVRHDDYSTRAATFYSAGNIEVPGYSELVHAVRSDVRAELRRRITARGADGAIVTRAMHVSINGIEVAEGHRDHMGFASMVATSIAHVGDRPESRDRPRSVLSLSLLKRSVP